MHQPYPSFNPDLPDSDDWGTRDLLYVVEQAAKVWGTSIKRPRLQVNDLSKRYGGGGLGHPSSHRNGLDVDIRYIRKSNEERPLDLASETQRVDFDTVRTAQLITWFKLNSRVTLIIVDSRTTILSGGKVVHDNAEHSDHFHVRVADSDGQP